MTVLITTTDAPSACALWDELNWQPIEKQVRRLQTRIAKAYRAGKHNKAKALQWILTHSFYAKVLAVKRVVQNKGAKTPGTDKIIWKTSEQKMQAALSLRRRGYHTQPLRRIYIAKKQMGKTRPISIPVMSCRAQQALYLLALEPISETMADKNSYGFRPLRCTADAIGQSFNVLARKSSAKYILEGDIKSCFDTISQSWLLENVPIDKSMLNKWLTAGYIEKGTLYPTEFGTPQGGIISATLLVITLSGLEQTVKSVALPRDKVHISIYADDFIITGNSKEVLEDKIKPTVAAFLSERGLTLSQEKTKITHIDEGFDFLSANIRKYNGKLLIKPSKDSVKRFLADIKATVKENATAKTENLIYLLNPKIRGWSNYHRNLCAKKTFSYVDSRIFTTLWNWSKRRHPEKGRRWVRMKYFRTKVNNNWAFFAKTKDKNGNRTNVDLVNASAVPIRRHVKIRADATPYDPTFREYLRERSQRTTNVKQFISPKKGDRKSIVLPEWIGS